MKGYNEPRLLTDTALLGRVQRLEANTVKIGDADYVALLALLAASSRETQSGTFDGVSGTFDLTYASGINITDPATLVLAPVRTMMGGGGPGFLETTRRDAVTVTVRSTSLVDDGTVEVTVIGVMP